MTKLLFSVTATETVIARYLPMIVEAADRDTAEAMVEAMRCDGDLGDPHTEDVQTVTYQTDQIDGAAPVVCEVCIDVTEAGEAAAARPFAGL